MKPLFGIPMFFTHLFQRITRAHHTADGHTAKGRALYELWSTDTFEGRTFLCDVYDSLGEARAALERCRREALSQDESLRDSFWLVESDPVAVAERERKESERLDARRREKRYDPAHLRAVCDRAADRFDAFLGREGEHPVMGRCVGAEWNHPDDCFDKVGFKMGWSAAHSVCFVSLWVWIRSSVHYHGGGVSTFVMDAPAIAGIREQLRDQEVRQRLYETARHLIEEHYRGDRP